MTMEAASADLELIVHDAHGNNKPETRLWLRMLSTTKLITNEIRRRLRAEFGATLPQFDRLEADGYVERVTPHADRRVTVARLTPSGVEFFTGMAAAHERWLKDIMADVDPDMVSSLWNEIGAVKASASNHLSGSADE